MAVFDPDGSVRDLAERLRRQYNAEDLYIEQVLSGQKPADLIEFFKVSKRARGQVSRWLAGFLGDKPNE